MNPLALARVLAPLVVLASISACRSQPQATEVAFAPVLAGPVSSLSAPTQFVARSPEEWLARWIGPSLSVGEKPRAPDIDWQREMLVCVGLGTRASGGYSVHVERIQCVGAELVVHAKEERPAPGSLQMTMLTMPFTCVSTARFDGEVRFEMH